MPPRINIRRSKDSGQTASPVEGEFEVHDDNSSSFEAIEGDIGDAHGLCPMNTVNVPTVEAANTTIPVVNHQTASGILDHSESIKALGLSFNLRIGETSDFSFAKQIHESVLTRTTPSQRVQATIHHMCHKAGAPRYLAGDILHYLHEEIIKNRINLRDSRTLVKPEKLMECFQEGLGIEPLEALPITLESGFRTTVFRFHIKDMMQRHLLSHVFADMKNINLDNPDEPFSGNQTNKLPLDYTDLNNGHWYKEAVTKYSELLRDGEHILHPWVLYGDKTGVDKVEKNTLEPIAISSSNLTRPVRETASNWILLGYIPNLKTLHKERSRSTTTNARSISLRDYHQCLFKLLEPFQKLQEEKPSFLFRRGGKIGRFKIIAPLMAVIGDNLSNDNLAQRVSDNSGSSPRFSRRCLCTFLESDNPVHRCHPICSRLVRKLSMGALGVTYGIQDEETTASMQSVIDQSQNLANWKNFIDNLEPRSRRKKAVTARKRRSLICDAVLHKVLGSHALINGFHGIDFGPLQNGIERATLTDILHTIEEGLVPMILKVFFGCMSESNRSAIDHYVTETFSTTKNRSCERGNYPRVTFRQGYTKLTRLGASERLGQLFLLSIILQTEEGKVLLKHRFAEDFDSKRLQSFARRKKCRAVHHESDDSHHDEERPCDLLSTASSPTTSEVHDESDDSVDNEERPYDLSAASPSTAEAHDESDDSDDDEERSCDLSTAPPTTSDDPTEGPSWEHIKLYLNSINLRYIHEELYPSLPQHHKCLLKNVLKQKMRSFCKGATTEFTEGELPNLDYRLPNSNQLAMTHEDDCKDEMAEWLPSDETVGDYWQPKIEYNRDDTDDLDESQKTIALDMHEFTYLVETIIAFHAFIKNPSCLVEEGDIDNTLRQSCFALALLLRVLVHGVWRGEKSNGWRLRKTVELSHFLRDVYMFGSADGFNSSTGERNLKVWAKQPSKTAQKRSADIHLKQTASRFQESFVFSEIAFADKLSCQNSDPSAQHSGNTVVEPYSINSNVGKFVLHIGTGQIFRFSDQKRSNPLVELPLSPTVISWFQGKYDGDITIFSEAKIDEDLCRAHANYRKEGPWFDFVACKSGDNFIPCRLSAIFREGEEQPLMALLHCPKDRKEKSYQFRDERTQLFSHWSLDSTAVTPATDPPCRQAVLKAVEYSELQCRIYCLDVNANLVGDHFHRTARESTNQACFDILWTERCEWQQKFLDSAEFLVPRR